MASIQERLQIKREPLDKWSVREQLCLASAVARSGDQNWMSVSRALKPFGDPNRPADWFHQKNCAAQYWALLENVETPKRKKRTSGPDTALETPAESILKNLKSERLAELKQLLAEEKVEYAKLQEDMATLQAGNVSEEQLDKWCKEIDEEEQQKEQESNAHSKWLKEREVRKQEIERAWRPVVKVNVNASGQKRKASESVDSATDSEIIEEQGLVTPIHTPESGKSSQSPLLTSLLKSPSHSQSVVTSSILHTAITSQRPTTTNPTIASLLNSSTNVSVSPSLQQLVSTAIGQDVQIITQEIATPDIQEDPDSILNNIKVEDIESSILASGDTLPEIKDEEVEVIISDLIENAEIVTDPEEHLQLDDNVDLMENLENELQELVKEEEENAAKDAAAALLESVDKVEEVEKDPVDLQVDPFEFQEEEVYTQPLKPVQQEKEVMEMKEVMEIKEEPILEELVINPEPRVEAKAVEEPKKGSVEIVEVVVMEDEEIDKELNKAQIEDIVHSTKTDTPITIESQSSSDDQNLEEIKTDKDSCEESNTESIDTETKSDVETTKDSVSTEEPTEAETTDDSKPALTPEFNEELYDANIGVKVDKSGKAKRDYSRNKKKEEKDLDLLFSVAQNQLEEEIETCSEKEFSEIENKTDIKKLKLENDRSNSPWTEEEDMSLRSRRRYSTPGTPVDSIPNSPGSTTTNEDDREYKNWKKSVLLIYSRLATHKYSSLFLKPITDDQAPGYHNIVYRPMDLHTIRKNIENGTIRTTAEFQRDVLLMFNNAIMYNKSNEHVFNMACEMQQEGIQQIQLFEQAQQADAPARRETRTGEREPNSKRKRVSEEPSRSKKRKED